MSNFLDKHFDALIVGGGIIGMLTARNLQSAGLSVAIIDKGKLGGQATWAAGGILSPLNPWQFSNATQSLIDEGRNGFAALADELNQETEIDPEFIQSGMIVLDIEQKQQALEWAKNNHEVVNILSAHELLACEANISSKFAEALYLPDIAQVRPPNLIAALQQSLSMRKVKIYDHTAVENLQIEQDSITGVITKNETLRSDKVIVCGGAWAKDLWQKDASIDIEPVRGQMLLYKSPKKLIEHILLKERSYVIPRQDGHILCGSTIEHVGFVNQVTSQARQELQTIAHQLVPLLTEHKPIKQWSALRPGTKRDKPYICNHPVITGLYLNSGHYRYGILMAIASARIMTDLVTDSLHTSQIAAFA